MSSKTSSSLAVFVLLALCSCAGGTEIDTLTAEVSQLQVEVVQLRAEVAALKKKEPQQEQVL